MQIEKIDAVMCLGNWEVSITSEDLSTLKVLSNKMKFLNQLIFQVMLI